MKYSLTLAAFAALAVAAPTETVEKREPELVARQSGSACAAAVTLAAGSNPFTGRTLHANSFYASEVTAAVAAISDSSLATKAAAVGKVGSFLWL
jgi:cellulose 1,4-beta-cellobiosidase